MSASTDSQRYGAPSPVRRRIVVGAAVVVAVLFGGWLAWTALFHADPAVSSELLTWDQVDDHETTAVVRVTYGDGWVDADCTVRAISEDKAIVGEVSFTPVEGEGPDHEVSINTERRPTAVELVGCTTEGQPRPR
ncbi:hypothetical protein HNR19_000921 [Nocardioides thalensis]|uniref:DUF4307 domain-containing protein n=1 Tax=Nocardioides thalensis TaxID=1914755 RepID=A0A853C1J4_9ACTN|nr:hypothetical protein [Nocardioides thalensis]